jgi:thiol-disulfide isomerase/thioredoxin
VRKELFYCFVLLCLASLSIQAQAAGSPAKLAEPILKLRGIDGRTYDLAEMRGNVVLVSFGATWCSPCTAELRALEELSVEYKTRPVKFFWVTIENDAEASDANLAKYARTRGLTFPVLRDPMKFTFNQFSPRVRLPMIVFFDKEGHADALPHFGMSSQPEIYKAAMRQRLNKLLATPRSEGQQE